MNSSVISGEASETDSDEDVGCSTSRTVMTASIQGAMIAGEDSESDDENAASISSAVSALAHSAKELEKGEVSAGESSRSDSLLHKKLRDCNNQLYTDVESFCNSVISQAGKNLSTIDQQLLKSQITLQSAVTSLRSLNLNSALIKEKLQCILSSKFIFNIKTNSQ